MAGFARRTAKRGYVAASLGYMLAGDKTKDVYSMNAVMDEIDAALQTLKDEATKRGAPLEKVALSGDSAGGHIATLYAYSRGKGAPLPVVFVAPRVGPSDFHVETWPNLEPSAVAGLVSAMTRTETTVDAMKAKTPEAEAAIAAVSPASFVEKGGAVPTLAAARIRWFRRRIGSGWSKRWKNRAFRSTSSTSRTPGICWRATRKRRSAAANFSSSTPSDI